jgi:acyl-coenzyme A thioesterase PaaI-like protein
MLHARLHGERRLSSINADIDYLTSARAQNMTARVRLVRVGRRIAFVEAVGWQKDEASPVAAGRFRFRIGEEK